MSNHRESMIDPCLKAIHGRRVLVTGAYGFIGSNLVSSLVEAGANVLGLDRDGAAVPNDFPAPVQATDLAELSELRSVFDDFRPQYVYHLASAPDGPENYDQVMRSLNGGLLLTVNLLEAFRQYPGELFVFADSSKVYGDPGVGYRESLPEDPRSSYAIAKSAAWQFCRYHYRLYGTKVVSIRPTVVYGPGQPRNLISYVVEQALEGARSLRLMGGRQTRDPLYLSDLMDAYLSLPRHKDRVTDRVINLGGGHEISIADLAQRIVSLLDGEMSVEIDESQARPTDSTRSFSDNSEAAELLDWQPRVSLDDGLMRTIDAARSIVATGKMGAERSKLAR